MRKILLLGLAIISTFLFSTLLPKTECRPVFFQKYRKERQEVRKKRLEIKSAEIRLNDLRRKNTRRASSELKAQKEGIHLGNSNRSRWIKKDKAQERIDINVRRHILSAKLLRDNPGVSQALLQRAKRLQAPSLELQEEKKILKKGGIESPTSYTMNSIEDWNKYRKFESKAIECLETISRNKAFLSRVEGQNRCTIL